MIENIVFHTNSEIRCKKERYDEQKFATSETCVEEIQAFFSLLVLSGTMESNHLSTNEIFDTTLCGQRYNE